MAHAVTFPTADNQRSRSTARPTGLRLTRRGRVVVLAFGLMVVLIAVLLSSALSAQADSTSRGPATSTVVVQAGESLWRIAQRIAPAADPRSVVTEIRDLNELGYRPVVVGQSLVVPLYAAA